MENMNLREYMVCIKTSYIEMVKPALKKEEYGVAFASMRQIVEIMGMVGFDLRLNHPSSWNCLNSAKLLCDELKKDEISPHRLEKSVEFFETYLNQCTMDRGDD